MKFKIGQASKIILYKTVIRTIFAYDIQLCGPSKP